MTLHMTHMTHLQFKCNVVENRFLLAECSVLARRRQHCTGRQSVLCSVEQAVARYLPNEMFVDMKCLHNSTQFTSKWLRAQHSPGL